MKSDARLRSRATEIRTLSFFTILLFVFLVIEVDLIHFQNATLYAAQTVPDKKLSPLSEQSLQRDVITYTGFGHHRTGGEGDLKTTTWIISELKKVGFEIELQKWNIRQFDLEGSSLEIDGGEKVACFPVWFPKKTDPEGIKAPLVFFGRGTDPLTVKGKIAVVMFSPPFVVSPTQEISGIIKSAMDEGAVAVIGITWHPSGAIKALNVQFPFNYAPWPIPVVVVGGDGQKALQEGEKAGKKAILLIKGKEDPQAEAQNIIGRLKRGKEWIVVSTPKTAWFQAAGERGPGVALFLGLARWAAESNSGPSWLFVVTSGHEIGDFGIIRVLKQRDIPRKEDVNCWLSLGSSIGATRWEKKEGKWVESKEKFIPPPQRFLRTDPEFLEVLSQAFETIPDIRPEVGNARGDLGFVRRSGYRAFGFGGGHLYSHSPQDGPECASPDLLAPIGKALVNALEDIIPK